MCLYSKEISCEYDAYLAENISPICLRNYEKLNSDFVPVVKVSTQREQIAYICGLRARIECERGSEHSTRSDRVTNIGYLLSLGASVLLHKSEFFQLL